MPKKRIGGKVTYIPVGAVQPKPTQNDSEETESENKIPFQQMSDQEKADAVMDAYNHAPFANLPDTTFQKFAKLNNIDHLPVMKNEDEMEKNTNEGLYRVVNAMTWTEADDIVANVMFSDDTWYSDSGGSAYGVGIYASNNLKDDIQAYSQRNRKSCIMEFKLNANASIIEERQVLQAMRDEIASGSAFGKALNRIEYYSAESIYALSMGHNVIVDNIVPQWRDYHVILDRGAVDMNYTYHKLTDAEKSSPPRTFKDLSR